MRDKLIDRALGKSYQGLKKKRIPPPFFDWVPLPVTNIHLKTL